MKRTVTILFLAILLINSGGYRLLTGYLQRHANNELEVRLDHLQYNDDELISIKTPVHLPYYNATAFERINGELTVNGVIYKYVKRRVLNDTLEVLCIKDVNRTSLQHAKEEFYRQSNGLVTHTKKTGSTSPVKPVFFEYCSQFANLNFAYRFLKLKHRLYYLPGSGSYTGHVGEQPPEC